MNREHRPSLSEPSERSGKGVEPEGARALMDGWSLRSTGDARTEGGGSARTPGTWRQKERVPSSSVWTVRGFIGVRKNPRARSRSEACEQEKSECFPSVTRQGAGVRPYKTPGRHRAPKKHRPGRLLCDREGHRQFTFSTLFARKRTGCARFKERTTPK